MKCLIINGSPKSNGNTARMIDEFKKNFSGEIEIVDVFRNISPCLDCGGCSKVSKCIIDDDFSKLTLDDYQVLFICSPIYMSNLPGPMLNLISRFNYIYNNCVCLNVKHEYKPKRAVLALVGGGSASELLMGEKNETNPIKQSKYIFKKLNAELKEADIVLCLNTNEQNVENNFKILDKISSIASSLSETI